MLKNKIKIFVVKGSPASKQVINNVKQNLKELNKIVYINFIYIDSAKKKEFQKRGINNFPCLLDNSGDLHVGLQNTVLFLRKVLSNINRINTQRNNERMEQMHSYEALVHKEINRIDDSEESDTMDSKKVQQRMSRAMQKRAAATPSKKTTSTRKPKQYQTIDDNSFISDSGMDNDLESVISHSGNYGNTNDGDTILEDFMSEVVDDFKGRSF